MRSSAHRATSPGSKCAAASHSTTSGAGGAAPTAAAIAGSQVLSLRSCAAGDSGRWANTLAAASGEAGSGSSRGLFASDSSDIVAHEFSPLPALVVL
jgi:hypothetical protein